MTIVTRSAWIFFFISSVVFWFSSASDVPENNAVYVPNNEPDPGCPSGYKAFGNYCFKFYTNDSFNWPEAEKFCASSVQGAHLVWITSAEENAFVMSLAGKTKSFLWLGGRRYCPNQNFYWPNEDEIGPYANWDPKTGLPALDGTDGCLQMKLDKSLSHGDEKPKPDERGMWSATDCGNKYGSTSRSDWKQRYPVCKVPKLTFSEPQKPDNNGMCDFGWCALDERSCFKLVDDAVVWQAARQSCRASFQAELASIHSWEDNNLTFAMFRGLWNDQRCDQYRSYVCMRGVKGHVIPPPPIAPTRGGCLKGWASHGGRCFKVMETALSFFAANSECQKTGDVIHSDLVSIHTPEQQGFVQSLLPENGVTSVWMGAYLNKTYYAWSNWSWTDETMYGDFENWKPVKKELKDGCSVLEGNRNAAKWVMIEVKNCSSMKLKFICAQINDPKIPPETPVPQRREEKVEMWGEMRVVPPARDTPEVKRTWSLMGGGMVGFGFFAGILLLLLLLVLLLLVKRGMFLGKKEQGFHKLLDPNPYGVDNPTKENFI